MPQVIQSFTRPSASVPGKVYTVHRYVDGSWSCNCPGWIFKRKGTTAARTCAHIREIQNTSAAALLRTRSGDTIVPQRRAERKTVQDSPAVRIDLTATPTSPSVIKLIQGLLEDKVITATIAAGLLEKALGSGSPSQSPASVPTPSPPPPSGEGRSRGYRHITLKKKGPSS